MQGGSAEERTQVRQDRQEYERRDRRIERSRAEVTRAAVYGRQTARLSGGGRVVGLAAELVVQVGWGGGAWGWGAGGRWVLSRRRTDREERNRLTLRQADGASLRKGIEGLTTTSDNMVSEAKD